VSQQEISKERAELVAKAHACERCGEYSYRQVRVKRAMPAQTEELGVIWVASKTCGICAAQQEIGIDVDGDIVYVA
jgi:hypothetical protein